MQFLTCLVWDIYSYWVVPRQWHYRSKLLTLVVDLGVVLPVPKRAQQSITDFYFLIKHDGSLMRGLVIKQAKLKHYNCIREGENNEIGWIISLGDEAGGCFSVYSGKFMQGRVLIYNLFLKFQMRREGCSFYGLR